MGPVESYSINDYIGIYCSFQKLKIRLTKLKKDVGGKSANSTLNGLGIHGSRNLFQSNLFTGSLSRWGHFSDKFKD